MASQSVEHQSNTELWEGGKSPFGSSYGKLMMWYFLLSDAFTFSGFLIAYGALRFSVPSWPLPDFVFRLFPFAGHTVLPLIFVTFMTFVLLFSSYTMVRAVQEGHRENKNGVVFWMFLTILGGAAFLGCQAWEWSTLIVKENMSVTQNPFGRHTVEGTYIDKSYEELHGHGHGDHSGGGHGDHHSMNLNEGNTSYALLTGGGGGDMHFKPGDSYLLHKVPKMDADGHEVLDANGEPVMEWYQRRFEYKDPKTGKMMKGKEELGPKAFGALFFCITGFHGFHVLSGVVFLIIVLLNVMSGIYEKRKNGYEMVEKIGLYWHFVDLVWVFVFLVFYLL